MRKSHEQLMQVAKSEISARHPESDDKNDGGSAKSSSVSRKVSLNI